MPTIRQNNGYAPVYFIAQCLLVTQQCNIKTCKSLEEGISDAYEKACLSSPLFHPFFFDTNFLKIL